MSAARRRADTEATGRHAWLAEWGPRAWWALGIVGIVVVALALLSAVSTVVTPMLLAVVLGVLFRPLVDAGERRGLHRAAGSALVVIAVVGAAIGLVFLVGRSLVAQAPDIARIARAAGDRIAQWFAGDEPSRQASDSIGSSASRTLSVLGGGIWSALAALAWSLVGFFVGAFFALFTLFFTLRDGHRFNGWLDQRLGLGALAGGSAIEDAEGAVRRYFTGTAITAVLTAPIVVIPMALLGLPLLLPVLIVYLVTSFVPYVGAWAAGAFAVLIALGSGGPRDALIVTVAVVVSNGAVQSTISSWAVGKRLSLHPVVVLAVTAIAGLTGGIVLMILAAPVTATVVITIRRAAEAREDHPAATAGVEDGNASHLSQPIG